MFVLKYYEGGVISNYKHVSLGVTGVWCAWVLAWGGGGFPGLSGRREVGRWEGAGAALPVADWPAWG